MNKAKFVEQTSPLKFFEVCLPQVFLGPFLNTLSQIMNKLALAGLKSFSKLDTENVVIRRKNAIRLV